MSISSSDVKRFWDERARRHRDDAGLTNLEEDEQLRRRKIAEEEARVADYLADLPTDVTVLDLGGGNGHWGLELAARARHVHVVDYCEPLLASGRAKAAAAGVGNITFEHAAAQDFDSPQPFDLIFISGLLLYLNDDELQALTGKLRGYSRPGTVLLLRDGTGTTGRHEITGRWSEALQASYAAIYRTRDEYLAALGAVGFACVRDDDMFVPGSPLNKWTESRLRIYRFERRG